MSIPSFAVHAENGTRLGCGLLERVKENVLTADTTKLTDAGVGGLLLSYTANDTICYFGQASSLEPNLLSVVDGSGNDCNSTNGCGVHVHAGLSCANTTTQRGHYYDNTTLTTDPWKLTGYLSTDSKGDASYTGCVQTGETDFIGRTFIVHSNNGSRVACGLLEEEENKPPSSPAGAPARPPSKSASASANQFPVAVTATLSALGTLLANW